MSNTTENHIETLSAEEIDSVSGGALIFPYPILPPILPILW